MKRLFVFCATLAIFACSLSATFAQAPAETDVAQSMGVGLKSRFASGATPIQLSRTEIRPGTPMSVNSTMSNMMSSSGNSFGGILARYDTSSFGKFFGSGTLTPRASSARVDALDDLAQGDNEVENVEVERMYPPRLSLNFQAYPRRSLTSPESKKAIGGQVENILKRFEARKEFDRQTEEVTITSIGTTVYLRGTVRQGRLSRLLESAIGLQAGVDEVVNELTVLEPETPDVDVFGRPSSSESSGRAL